MSFTKRLLEDQDGLNDLALGLLLEFEVIDECEYHSGTYIDQCNEEALKKVYKVAAARIRDGELVIPSGAVLRDLTDAIQSVLSDADHDCPSCESWGE